MNIYIKILHSIISRAHAQVRRLTVESTERHHVVSARERARMIRLVAISVMAGMGLATGSVANDMYLRGGIGVDWPVPAVFTDVDCDSTPRAALYGCGTGHDGAPTRSTGRFDSVTAVELGLGYRVKAARLEVLLEYRPGFTFEGRANFLAPERRQSVSAELSTVSGMFAVYLDLPRLGVPALGPVEPFVGAGLGTVRTEIGTTTMDFPRTMTIVPGGRRTGKAWMVTAGVALPLTERVSLDLAWRRTDLGEVHTGEGGGEVVWRDGSRDPVPLDLAPTRAKLAGEGIRMSLRYAF